MRHILTPDRLRGLVGGRIEFIDNDLKHHECGAIASIQLIPKGGHLELEITCSWMAQAKDPSNLSKDGWKSTRRREHCISFVNKYIAKENENDGRIYLQFDTQTVILSPSDFKHFLDERDITNS